VPTVEKFWRRTVRGIPQSPAPDLTVGMSISLGSPPLLRLRADKGRNVGAPQRAQIPMAMPISQQDLHA